MTQVVARNERLSPGTAVPRIVLGMGAPLLFLFGGAGTWSWRGAWVYMAVLVAGMGAAMAVFRKHPDLARERATAWHEATHFDRVILAIVGVIGPWAVQLVAGLDRRFGWSPPFPLGLHVIGACAFAAGAAVTAWAMWVNRFFSSVVRIQSDRGHMVITEGPYTLIRHPGYAAMIVATIGTPLLLGSTWASVPAGIVIAAFLARTINEDRALQSELPGYRAYAQRVRYRLLPGLW